MKIDTVGNYTLRYTAEDECGNETVIDRSLVVAAPRSVLYTDGTFIINESPRDMAANEALHGVATNVYVPFDPNGTTARRRYEFANEGERPWDGQRNSIVSVEIGGEVSPISMAYWFSNLSNCTSIELQNIDTQNTRNFTHCFSKCGSLASLDVENLVKSSATDLSYMFEKCINLVDLDVSNWDTSNVTDMSQMFYAGDNTITLKLTTFDVSNWNTSKVTNMYGMFWGCQYLTSLDVSNWDTSNVTDMSCMFIRCVRIKTLDLSNWDTSNVTDMSQMFSGSYYETMRIETIYASSNFIVSQVTYSTNMFSNCRSILVGGAGTVWSSSNANDKTYAHIDGGTSNPGYFTAKPTA